MLKWLLKSLTILVIFVHFATCLPLAALSLCRTARWRCSGSAHGRAVS